MSGTMEKIAIIGGGITGLACARVLSAAGHNVHIFDKGRGPGGRMSTRRVTTDLGEVGFDHGAQYFTARDPAFLAEIHRLMAVGAVGTWSGELVKLNNRDGQNTPLATEPLYVGTPAMNAVVRALGQDLAIAWSTRVETIAPAGSAWRLTSESGVDLGRYDAIVCAVPAEQVAPLLEGVAPSFAAQGKAITSLPCWAGMFVCERPFGIPFDAMRVENHPIIDFIAMNFSKPGRADIASYVVHARADWSVAHLEDSAEDVAEHLAAALLGYADSPPKVIHASAHRWRYARVDTAHGPGCLWDPEANIGVCGDWLSGPRVESAWLSGHQLGLKMTGQNVGAKTGVTKTAVQAAGE
jgi:renalase